MIEERLELPPEAWYLAWAFLVGEILLLVEHGSQSSDSIPLSVILSVAIVVWFSYGVLTARPLRVVLVWIVMVIALVGQTFTMLDDASGSHFVQLLTVAVQVACLKAFTSTDYYVSLRADPNRPRVSLEAILAIAVAVGVLGGIAGTSNDEGAHFSVNF